MDIRSIVTKRPREWEANEDEGITRHYINMQTNAYNTALEQHQQQQSQNQHQQQQQIHQQQPIYDSNAFMHTQYNQQTRTNTANPITPNTLNASDNANKPNTINTIPGGERASSNHINPNTQGGANLNQSMYSMANPQQSTYQDMMMGSLHQQAQERAQRQAYIHPSYLHQQQPTPMMHYQHIQNNPMYHPNLNLPMQHMPMNGYPTHMHLQTPYMYPSNSYQRPYMPYAVPNR